MLSHSVKWCSDELLICSCCCEQGKNDGWVAFNYFYSKEGTAEFSTCTSRSSNLHQGGHDCWSVRTFHRTEKIFFQRSTYAQPSALLETRPAHVIRRGGAMSSSINFGPSKVQKVAAPPPSSQKVVNAPSQQQPAKHAEVAAPEPAVIPVPKTNTIPIDRRKVSAFTSSIF